MKLLFAYIFTGLISFSSMAQMVVVKERHSGYLGKKGMVGFNINLSPSIHPQKAYFDDTEYVGDEFSIMREAEFYYEYALKKGVSASLLFGMHRTSVITKELGSFRNPYYGSPQFKDKYFGVNFKFFRKKVGSIAPMGQYVKLGIRSHSVTSDYTSNVLTFESKPPLEFDKFDDEKFNFVTLDLQFGFRSIIKDFLYYDVAFGGSGSSVYFSDSYYPDYRSDREERYVEKTKEALFAERYRLYNAISLSFGLGYLIH